MINTKNTVLTGNSRKYRDDERKKEREERERDESRAKVGDPVSVAKAPEAMNYINADKGSDSKITAGNAIVSANSSANNSSDNRSKKNTSLSGKQFESYALSDEARASQNNITFEEAADTINMASSPYGYPASRESNSVYLSNSDADEKPLYADSEEYQGFQNLIATCDPETGVYVMDDADGRMITNPAILDGAEDYIINKTPQTPKTYVRDYTYSYVNEYVHAGNDPEKLEELSKKYVVSPQLTTYAEITPFMNEQERRDFYILYNSGYKEEALQYLKTIEPETNKRRREHKEAEIVQLIEDSEWNKIPLSIQALAYNLLGDIAGIIQPIGMLANPDEWSDFNSPIYDYAAYSSLITNGITEDISEDSKLVALGYELLMNAAEGASEKVVFGPISDFASFMGDIYVDNYNNIDAGMDNGRAYLTAIGGNALNLGMSKAVEEIGGVYKELPDDFSFKDQRQLKKLLQDASFKAVGNYYGSLNHAYWDYLLNRSNATMNREINSAISQGYSQAQARNMVIGNGAKEAASDALVDSLLLFMPNS